MKKVVFCIPTMTRPFQACLSSLKASVPLLDKAGWDHQMVTEVGCPYISGARATMLRKALDAKADVICFLDHDLSWRANDLLKLLNVEDEVVAGLYRFKEEKEKYMGLIDDDEVTHIPKMRADGCVKATRVPAGFLKVTKEAVGRFMSHYPDLCYGEKYHLSVDLFNHGAHNGLWWGEDYAFSRNWTDLGGEIWVVPDLTLGHHTKDEVYLGNWHSYMMSLKEAA